MGIKNLFKLINSNAPNAISEKKIKEYSGKVIIIDASIVIYQYVIAIRNTGNDLKNEKGEMTTHIIAVINKAFTLLSYNIIPVFILDGKADKLKDNILQERRNQKNKSKKNLENNDYKEDKDRIKDFKKSFVLTNKHIIEIETILKLFGIPTIRNTSEADPLCADLVKKQLGYGVASEDMDILTFGSPILIRNLSPKKKIKEINLNTFLSEMNINQDEFIDLCILLGCDYIDVIPKIGIKKALDIILKYRSIDKFLENESDKYKIPANYNYKEVRNIFKNPEITKVKVKKFNLKSPSYKKINDLLLSEYNFSTKQINSYISKLKKYNKNLK